jgi:hypothetical protein
MEPFDSIEKLITEHGSAAVLSIWNDKLRHEAALIEKKFSESQLKIRELESNLKTAHEQIQSLTKLHEEDVCIQSGVEFRRGRRTAGKWLPFCPACGGLMRALDPRFGVVCSKCKAHSPFVSSELDKIIASIPMA